MKTPVYRLMSDGQNDHLRSLLVTLEAPLGVSWEFRQGNGPDGLTYLCGLPASRLLESHTVIAAPVLFPARYLDLPVYFSDIITRSGQEAEWDNRPGATWAYNERGSFSGWVAVVDGLHRRGVDLARFVWVETGSHLRSLAMVGDKHADLCGIDSMVWDVETSARPRLAQQLTVVASFGPWPMPPLMASRRLDANLLRDLSEAIASTRIENGLISRWAVVDDRHLDPIIGVVQSLTERSLLP